MRHSVESENANVTLLGERGIAARRLCYEEIVCDRVATLTTIAGAAGITRAADQFACDGDHTLEKIADAWNREADDRFRTECADVVCDPRATRLIRDTHNSSRMRGHPMARDIDPPRDPHAGESHHVIQQALQANCATGMTDDPIV